MTLEIPAQIWLNLETACLTLLERQKSPVPWTEPTQDDSA